MKICSNDLWICQEFETFSIRVESRSRTGKLILVYDYVSQFILCGQFYFSGGVAGNVRRILYESWKYGVPKRISIQGSSMKTYFAERVKEELGIEFLMEDEKRKKDVAESFTIRWNEILRTLGETEVQNVQGFYSILKEKILRWNLTKSTAIKNDVPVLRFQQDIRNHIFVDKQMIRECSLYKCMVKATEYATVQIMHRIYQVPDEYAGKELEVSVSGLQKNEIFIYEESLHRLLFRCPKVGEVECYM